MYTPPPGYAPFGAPNSQAPRNNGLCIASLVLGIVGIVVCCAGILSALAIVFGFVGRNQVKKSGGTQSGEGMALAGIILGVVGIGIFVALLASGGGTFRIGPR